ncbi:MAG TPA: dienelactone hydrolase family protein [Ktedonobacteraceae bacterium]|nr:dienelactone hydrolase family protein [Ktedonobacteraceae bacterium]
MANETGTMLTYDGEAGPLQAYLVKPATEEPRPAVIVIHEIVGLTDHIKNVADRFAGEGYVAFAPNLFSRPGLGEVLTPANVGVTMQFMSTVSWERARDSAYVQQAMSQLPQEKRDIVQRVFPVMFGGIPKDKLTQDLVNAIAYLKEQPFVQKDRIGSIGFCFGGGMSINLACHAKLAASVLFYGENPNPIELVERISCPVLCNYGAEDMRINAHLDTLVKAMVTYKKDFEMRIYPHAGHAFFNDTTPMYNETAAKDAWQRVLSFYERTLRAS